MITDVDIAAGRLPLSNAKQMALILLIKRVPLKKRRPTNIYDLAARIDAVKGTGDPNSPTSPADPDMTAIKGMALDAVLTRLRSLPGVVVEDEGTDKEKVFFGTAQNWEELAQDALDVLYDTQGSSQVFLLAQRTLENYADYRRCGPLDEFYGLRGRRW